MSGPEILSRVGVVIVNHDTRDVLRRCLETLAPGEAGGLQAIVVDTASADGSAEMVRRDFSWARLVEAGGNPGFGAAVNMGARDSDRDFILVLNADCFIPPADIAMLAERMAADDALGFAGPRIELASGAVDHASLRADPDPVGALIYFSRLPQLFPGRAGLNRYSLAHADYRAEQELLAGTAACLIVRASAFRQVGGFDESFYMYGEDLDLCRRLREAGFRGRYLPAAVALHVKGESSRKQSRRMLVEFHKSMWVYYRKHEKPRRAAPLNWAVAAGITALAGVRIGVNAVRRDKRVSRR